MPDAISVEAALARVPKTFRTKLIKHYQNLKQAYVRADFGACGTHAGKFSETLIRCVQDLLEGQHTKFGEQLNLYIEAHRLENLQKTIGPEPLRVFIPRALCFLYTLRNKRGFAHVGGDLDSDPVDAITCVRVADWCLCELIRVVHNLPLEDAQTLVNAVSAKEVPDVWDVAGKKRVLKAGLEYKAQTLLLLYSTVNEAVLVEDLLDWTEYSRMDNYKRNVIGPLHKSRLVEWDKDTDAVLISPTGIWHVEQEILELGTEKI